MFYRQLCRAGLEGFDREYQFAAPRKWRFDFAWPEDKLAVEIDGGVWFGRHTRGGGFIKDCEKLNTAALQGWRVFRFVPQWVEDGKAIETMKSVLGSLF